MKDKRINPIQATKDTYYIYFNDRTRNNRTIPGPFGSSKMAIEGYRCRLTLTDFPYNLCKYHRNDWQHSEYFFAIMSPWGSMVCNSFHILVLTLLRSYIVYAYARVHARVCAMREGERNWTIVSQRLVTMCGLAVVEAISDSRTSIGVRSSYSVGACRMMPAVPTNTASVKIHRNSLSSTIATYFQSSLTWTQFTITIK